MDEIDPSEKAFLYHDPIFQNPIAIIKFIQNIQLDNFETMEEVCGDYFKD